MSHKIIDVKLYRQRHQKFNLIYTIEQNFFFKSNKYLEIKTEIFCPKQVYVQTMAIFKAIKYIPLRRIIIPDLT